MNSVKASSKRLAVYVTTFVAAVIGIASLIGATASSSLTSSPKPSKIPAATQAAPGLKITGRNATGGGVSLTVRNDYPKPITAFTFAVGTTKVEEDLIYGGGSIMPAGSYEVTLSGDYAGKDARVLCVVFADGTEDGESSSVAYIRGRRHGEKLQMQRFNKILDDFLSKPDAELSRSLPDLKAKVRELPDRSGASTVDVGLHNGKEEATAAVEGLLEEDTSPTELRKRTERSLNANQSRIAKLQQ